MRGGVNLENLFNYSIDETPIGTWNGETLYRKVINIGALPNASNKVYTWNIPDIKSVIRYELYAYDNAQGSVLSLPYIYPDVQYIDYWITVEYVTPNSVQIIAHTNRSGFVGYIILEYTKNE